MRILNKNKKKKGFTLIELVAVVAIIGILAALLVPKIAGYITDAKKTKVIDQARKVVMAVETANTKHDITLDKTTSVSDILTVAAGGNKTLLEAKKYLDPDGGGQTVIAPNLTAGTTFEQCKGVTEGVEFEIDKSSGILSKVNGVAVK
ncbi:MAG: type II secretion system protein [Clostridium sp.]|uniref:type II secretion system protein n=1 Tax=Clostridium sp. TaxID=1506 RepID=UPI003F356634